MVKQWSVADSTKIQHNFIIEHEKGSSSGSPTGLNHMTSNTSNATTSLLISSTSVHITVDAFLSFATMFGTARIMIS